MLKLKTMRRPLGNLFFILNYFFIAPLHLVSHHFMLIIICIRIYFSFIIMIMVMMILWMASAIFAFFCSILQTVFVYRDHHELIIMSSKEKFIMSFILSFYNFFFVRYCSYWGNVEIIDYFFKNLNSSFIRFFEIVNYIF